MIIIRENLNEAVQHGKELETAKQLSNKIGELERLIMRTFGPGGGVEDGISTLYYAIWLAAITEFIYSSNSSK